MHLLIVLDGADPILARKYFKKIKEIGKIKDYKTYDNTGASFGSVLTGLSPKKHGLEDLFFDSNLDKMKGEPFWERIDSKIGIANIPILWPPKPINGWMICGMLSAPGKVYTYPKNLTEELNRIGYEIWPEKTKKQHNILTNFIGYLSRYYMPYFFDNPVEAIKVLTPNNIKMFISGVKKSGSNPKDIDNKWWVTEWKRIIKKRTKGFIYLLNKHPIDIGLLCYKALDTIQHRLFHKPEIIKKWYEIQDKEVEKLLKGLKEKPESITIFSDHGFKRVERGFITGTHRTTGMFLSTINNKVKKIEDIYNLIVGLSNE